MLCPARPLRDLALPSIARGDSPARRLPLAPSLGARARLLLLWPLHRVRALAAHPPLATPLIARAIQRSLAPPLRQPCLVWLRVDQAPRVLQAKVHRVFHRLIVALLVAFHARAGECALPTRRDDGARPMNPRRDQAVQPNLRVLCALPLDTSPRP